MFEYMVCIGLRLCDYYKVEEVMERLQSKYPRQKWKIYVFPEKKAFPKGGESFDFILVVFTDNYDKAHRIGMALVKKILPEAGVETKPLAYWIKEDF